MEQKLRIDWSRQLSRNTREKKKADAQIWAEMDIEQEQRQGPRDEGVAKAENQLEKKQRKRQLDQSMKTKLK